MSEETYNELRKKENIDTSKSIKLIIYGEDTFKTLGTTEFVCIAKDKRSTLTFHVVSKQVKTLLGLRDTLEMNLITLDNEVHEVEPPEPRTTGMHRSIMHEYSDLFDGAVGKLPVVYKMKLDPDVTPVVRPPHRIPIAMRERAKKELDDMIEKNE